MTQLCTDGCHRPQTDFGAEQALRNLKPGKIMLLYTEKSTINGEQNTGLSRRDAFKVIQLSESMYNLGKIFIFSRAVTSYVNGYRLYDFFVLRFQPRKR